MELGQLKIFLAVIDHGGFRRAAARLYLSQPAVSRHIADLERSLGVGLFHREKGRVWLTAAGERFAERAQRIVDQCEEAVREARAERQQSATMTAR
jgi:DNA-binding transcriptional LysR family regulator